MSFANPLFLFALFAVSIPVIIHLFNFRRYKVVYFSNTKLLRDIKEQTKAQSQLKHLLTLLCRILFITALVFAFARPFIPVDGITNSEENNTVSIYIDNSFSMDAEGENGRLAEAAKNLAVEITGMYDRKTRFLLITNDQETRHMHLLTADKLLEYVSEMTVSPRTLDIRDVVEKQKNFFLNSEKGKQQAFYIISDFQKSTSSLKLIKPDSNTVYNLVHMKNQSTGNLYIDSCWFESPARIFNQPEELFIKVVNKSDQNQFKIPVRLSINDSLKSIGSVDIESNSEKTISLSYTNSQKGLFKGMIEISDYPITYDNVFYFSYVISEKINVLSINSVPSGKYISTLFSADDYFNFQEVSEKNIDYFSFPKNDLIILNEPEKVQSGLIQQLREYVEKGGSLIFIPGAKTDLKSCNDLMASLNSPAYSKTDTADTEVKTINFQSRIYKNVFRKTEENVSLPILFSRMKINPSGRSMTETILGDKTGSPALACTPNNKGKVYSFSFSIDPSSSNFARHPLFVPTFYNIACNAKETSEIYHLIGKNNVIDVPEVETKNSDDIFHLVSTENNVDYIPETRQNIGGSSIIVNSELRTAGNYVLMNNNKPAYVFSFNYDRTESDLSCFSKDELLEFAGQPQNKNFKVFEGNADTIQSEVKSINEGIQLWKWFIFAALFFLLAEIAILRLL
ncbi:MAG: hypothetical protein A2W91_09725 [Bacteroidetes bacterium GWF2_38_335]|nr:MAG: hypothetical protein A2W91_09725 [Bacteroidetes bacterium GWF2_38_335]OFY78868.1 MAG: hypothetical protein A2281_14060 [Bacteroidetes bacterium RIFOXYA12_FULL_38_20]HBS86287.1 hypothetical protein [Bacteroidales bacterium]